jgi:hypothetical protein
MEVGVMAITTRVSELLCLAATPTFGFLAVLTFLGSGPPDMLCIGMPQNALLNGMGLMYALMSVFHAAPWLRLAARSRPIYR